MLKSCSKDLLKARLDSAGKFEFLMHHVHRDEDDRESGNSKESSETLMEKLKQFLESDNQGSDDDEHMEEASEGGESEQSEQRPPLSSSEQSQAPVEEQKANPPPVLPLEARGHQFKQVTVMPLIRSVHNSDDESGEHDLPDQEATPRRDVLLPRHLYQLGRPLEYVVSSVSRNNNGHNGETLFPFEPQFDFAVVNDAERMQAERARWWDAVDAEQLEMMPYEVDPEFMGDSADDDQ